MNVRWYVLAAVGLVTVVDVIRFQGANLWWLAGGFALGMALRKGLDRA